jgi:hypothetical protein
MGIPAGVLQQLDGVGGAVGVDAERRARASFDCCIYLRSGSRGGDTIGWLQRVPIAFFAIDEAHCISEWGHEFRPEYRQLSALRQYFPDSPIAAFTASATRHVRHDILQQLQLRSRTSISSASIGPICATWCGSAPGRHRPDCC